MNATTNSSTPTFKVISPSLISVCMFCSPGASIFVVFPELQGRYEVSHGICPAHLAKMREELAALKR